MARTPNPTAEAVDITLNADDLQQDVRAANELSALVLAQQAGAVTLARELGYEGALTVGALEDEIRFYQRRSVEALLEAGKRLLLLKEVTSHGEFAQRVEMLGFSGRTAQRFMQAATKVSKSANLAVLSSQVKSASAFLELITHDDDVIEEVAQLDDIDRLSASQLRAKVREMKAEVAAKEQRLEVVNRQREAAEEKAARIAVMPPDEALIGLRAKVAELSDEAMGKVNGALRQGFAALVEHHQRHGGGDSTHILAGHLGQLQQLLNELRDEFNLPNTVGDGTPEWQRWSDAQDGLDAAEAAQK